MLDVEQWQCTVRSNDNVATMIKELVLDLPPGKDFQFRAGSYMPGLLHHLTHWLQGFRRGAELPRRMGPARSWRYASMARRQETRAYSMANYPGEDDGIKLDVRIAIPPPGADPSVPPGVVSSYIFSLKPGDTVTVSGPFGHFYAPDTQNEMVFIGGGAGHGADALAHHGSTVPAPVRTARSVSGTAPEAGGNCSMSTTSTGFKADHANFEWHVALSDPKPNDGSRGGPVSSMRCFEKTTSKPTRRLKNANTTSAVRR